MTKGILGRKVGMTTVFQQDGTAVPVTVLEAGPCSITQVRTLDRDGYSAVQLGFSDKPRRLARRSERGHVAPIGSIRSKKLAAAGLPVGERAGCEPKRFVREFRLAEAAQFPVELKVGGAVTVNILDGVAAVDVTGITKGCGFQGTMKKHGFKGQRATHGVKKVHRHPGGTGAGTYPGNTIKGKKMAGRYGSDRVTMRNLKVVRVDADNHLLLVRGAVPGPAGAFVIIRETNKLG
jgi:large subunit ribosomal protein L3